MDRLTKRISGYAHGAEGVSADRLTGNYCRGEFEATACVEKLAEYEDLEEQGKLPVAVGDTVYFIKSAFLYMSEPKEEKVRKIELVNGETIFRTENRTFRANNIGKTVFLTQEAAEAALKEL